ncbi:MAG: TetR/AcrR family transcriptional regulator [Sulfurimonas sp.]|nr:TetR/AcrR family transcriptional regulator [Sulfurimonas sp.]
MNDRKTQIIKHSVELVKKYGYDSFSYADISKDFGITKATIHHHFPKKDDLGLEICYYIHENMLTAFDKILSENTPAKKKIQEYIALYANMIDEGDKICPIASLQAESNIISEKMKKEVCTIDDLENMFIEKLLHLGIQSKEFTITGNIKYEAILITSALKGALMYARIHGEENYEMISKQLLMRLNI